MISGSLESPAGMRRWRMIKSFLFLCTLLPLTAEPAETHEFLANDQVRIGVDMASGGAVFWFSELPVNRNLLNHFDRGRFIQQSYYGHTDGSMWVKKPWRWNPVQGGDYKGKPARVVEKLVKPDSLYVKSIPVNWAGGEDLEDCRMEEWISLAGKVATIRFRFTYRGNVDNPKTHQEMPAVFVDFALSKLVCYTGDKPWTGAPLREDVPGWPNESRTVTEEWAAYVGDDGHGVGVHFPGTREMTCYRFPGPPGPEGSGCSYFAPLRTTAIVPGFQQEYTIHMTIGTVPEIRERFGKLAKPLAAPQKK